MDVTRECFFEGLKVAQAGNHLNDISKAIGAYAAEYSLWDCTRPGWTWNRHSSS